LSHAQSVALTTIPHGENITHQKRACNPEIKKGVAEDHPATPLSYIDTAA